MVIGHGGAGHGWSVWQMRPAVECRQAFGFRCAFPWHQRDDWGYGMGISSLGPDDNRPNKKKTFSDAGGMCGMPGYGLNIPRPDNCNDAEEVAVCEVSADPVSSKEQSEEQAVCRVSGADDEPSFCFHAVSDPGMPDVKAAGHDITEAAVVALAEVISVPITNVIMAGVMPLDGAGTNVAAGEQIDKTCEALQDIADWAKIPSALVGHAVTHFLMPVATAAFGPIGPVIAIFAGNFAGEITHQTLDAGLCSEGIQYAENASEVAGASADALIGRLAESQPFSDYISSLVGRQIGAIITKGMDATASHKTESATGKARTITAVVAVYEVNVPLDRSQTARVGLAAFGVLGCIPAETVVKRWKKGPHEFLLLANGICLQRRIDGIRPGGWSRAASFDA